MNTAKDEIETLLKNGGGVVARRRHPELTSSLEWLVRQGQLLPVLPGVYAADGSEGDFGVRIRAALLWDPDAVVVGASAARLSFWPKLAVPAVGLAVTRQHRCRPRGFEVTRRSIPPELVDTRAGIRLTCPALTALDLCETLGGDGIDTALRTRAVTLDALRTAIDLSPGRRGNATRRQLLLDSRDEPWSAAERLGHRVLREAGILGWRANLPVVAAGQLYYLDVAWEEQRLVLEIDGRLHETDSQLFESDRRRQNHLVLQGWRVLRCTWRMLTDHPEQVVQAVRAALSLDLSHSMTRRAGRPA